jgi:hypothetical protein
MAIIALFYAEQKLRIARCNLQEIERDLKLWEQARNLNLPLFVDWPGEVHNS